MKKIAIIVTFILSSLFVAMPTAFADGVSKQQAANIAQGEYQGRVIAVKLMKFNGRLAYRVKVLDRSGGMHIVIIDKATGDVVSSR
ncbi:MAG: PepSY domain-containing protein [Thioalkalispiraceae bacterium]